MKDKSPQTKRLEEMAANIKREKPLARKVHELTELVYSLPLRKELLDPFVDSILSLADATERNGFFQGAHSMLEILKVMPVENSAGGE